ncbi:MAG TPA: succinyl-diaminopimelate desuccinylase, partial [Pseudoxanthomonas sp.]|nr:succinyl-diaminopimelate desuccinylase [Pseudoxanthomonas sp.]
EPSATARVGDSIKIGRRGSLNGRITVTGVQGHVAYPHKALNPIHKSLPALTELAARKWDDGYETFPPTSLQISNIHAGTGASNVIPGELSLVFNLRFNPSWTAEKLEQEIEGILGRHGLDYDLHWHRGGEPFYTPEGHLRATARQVLGGFAGAPPEESTAGGTSDARFIAPLGAQCIEIGPVNASIHKVDEHIALAELEALPGLYQTLVERLLLK